MKGKLICLEGIDGSGKNTQLTLLLKRLNEYESGVETLSFPQYDEPSSYFVKQYLAVSQPYGDPHTITPEQASLFYALDRFEAKFKIQKWLDAGKTVVLDRYVASNAGHQGGRIESEAKREKFIKWLYDLEFKKLQVPKPDITVILSLPVEVSMQRIIARGRPMDNHEKDRDHLEKAKACYAWLAEKYPDEYALVECVANDGRELLPEEIHELVWNKIRETIYSK